jgi:hypothetical protein
MTESWAFVDELAALKVSTSALRSLLRLFFCYQKKLRLPLILVHHVPLYKPSGACVGDKPEFMTRDDEYECRVLCSVHDHPLPCSESAGYVFQTLLTRKTTNTLLHQLKPVMVSVYAVGVLVA